MTDTRKTMTFDEAGEELAKLARLTAQHSQNWKNFASIATSMLKQAYDAGCDDGVAGMQSGPR